MALQWGHQDDRLLQIFRASDAPSRSPTHILFGTSCGILVSGGVSTPSSTHSAGTTLRARTLSKRSRQWKFSAATLLWTFSNRDSIRVDSRRSLDFLYQVLIRIINTFSWRDLLTRLLRHSASDANLSSSSHPMIDRPASSSGIAMERDVELAVIGPWSLYHTKPRVWAWGNASLLTIIGVGEDPEIEALLFRGAWRQL